MLEDVLTRHPHARAVLMGALAPGGEPSHAYLFHGPAGSGKREAATEFAAVLLSAGAPDPENSAQRVRGGVHPDYTRVAPSGAAGLITEDIERPVIAAATRTPFESKRRVFVIEQADSMNDVASNRMLKTLEEPASFVVLILLTDQPAAMMETIVSRCQPVRFEAASAAELRERLQNSHGIPPETAAACAQLSLGDGELALRLALGEGESLRAAAQKYTRAVIAGSLVDARSALLLEQAAEHERRAKDEVEARFVAEAEVLGDRDRKRHEREGETAAKRAARRAKAQTLDDGLRLVSLWLRDVAVAADGEPGLIRNGDRADLITEDAQTTDSARAREAVALVEESRTTLILNPSEPLLLDALASRMERALNG
jgi:DNA polymerase-3 subunit delta'